MIKDHAASIVALGIIAIIFLVLALHGMKDETLLAILATGAVGVANAIAGVKTSKDNAAPVIVSTVNPDPDQETK